MIVGAPHLNSPTGYGFEPQEKQQSIPVQLTKVTEKNIGQIRKLNLATLPVSYHEQFYTDLASHTEFSTLAYYSDTLVGALCCRLEPCPEDSKVNRLYIMTFSVLSAYRKAGIAKRMFDWLLETVKPKVATKHIREICLHVQTSNETALQLYRKLNFTEVEVIDHYYNLNIVPRSAIFLSYPLE